MSWEIPEDDDDKSKSGCGSNGLKSWWCKFGKMCSSSGKSTVGIVRGKKEFFFKI